MNLQNKSNIYTISNAAPPSYAEATGLSTSTRTYNPEFNQRYPHVAVRSSPSAPSSCSYPATFYLNNTPDVQSTYPQYESAQRQNQPISIPHTRILVTRNRREPTPCFRCFQFLWLAVTIAVVVGILTIIIKAARSP